MLDNRVFRLFYKSLAILLLTGVILTGLGLVPLPDTGGNLQQTSRNLFFHVPQWFAMYLMMFLSFTWSISYMMTGNADDDLKAREAAWMGVFFGVLGLITGILWGRVTWGEALADSNPRAWWVWDPKQTGALIAILAYLAYFVLRGSVEQPRQRAKLAAVYNVFAAAALVPLTLIIPRLLGGLHPGGSNGSPFTGTQITSSYRTIFLIAIAGFLCLALWLLELRVRVARLQPQTESN